MNLVKIDSTSWDKAKKLLVKVLLWGRNSGHQPKQAAPFGIDSNPVKGLVGVYAQINANESVLVGYLNKDLLAQVGETRLFSTDNNGSLQTYIWLKKDGNILIGGDTDNAVGYTKLATEFNELKGKFNDLVTLFNSHTHIASAFGSPTTTPASGAQPSAADISQAKKDKIKLG